MELSSATRPAAAAGPGEAAARPAWWWTGATGLPGLSVAASETELLSAAVLCAALGATKADVSSASDPESVSRAVRELEAHVRKSPLPHNLQFPVLEFTSDYVLMETELAVVCAIRATKTSDILETVVGSAVPISQPYVHRFGGARIHAPFWKRTQRLELQPLFRRAHQVKKVLVLSGHSMAGSIAHLALCELAFQRLPTKARLFLERLDFDERKKDLADKAGGSVDGEDNRRARPEFKNLREYLAACTAEEHEQVLAGLPQAMAVGFGAPYIGSSRLLPFLEPLGLLPRMINFVNEFDCIPSILNVAQSAAMLAKTTERVVTITRATTTLLKMLPMHMQQRFVNLAATSGTSVVPNAASAYLGMSLSLLQNTFRTFRDMDVVKDIDYQYSPVGTYIFLTKNGNEYQIYSDSSAIAKELMRGDDATTSLTGNTVLQHLMSAYVDAVARRSNSIQINATMDFYERLGVPRNANKRQIRTAYKALALKWHPDRWANASANPQEQATAEEIFKLLAEAYEVLSDDAARKTYDVHLSKPTSIKDEFVRQGTVNGMTLDEAIATFRDVIDNLSGAVSKVTSRFSTSSSTVVGHPLQHNGAAASSRTGLVANNHDNIFMPDRIRVSRTVGIGTDQREQILYLQPEEVVTGDVAAPTQTASGSGARVGLRTMSVVGGAVAVGASVALIVNAWSQYSDISKKKHQASVVRDMPGECLLLLLEDHRNTQQSSDHTQMLLQQSADRQRQLAAGSNTDATSENRSVRDVIVRGAQQAIVEKRRREEEEENALVDEFFDCVTDLDHASMEALAEEEFFDCVDLMEDVQAHFGPEAIPEEAKPAVAEPEAFFPIGSTVSTPFGLGMLIDWRENESSAVVRFGEPAFMVGYIQKSLVTRGATLARTSASEAVEAKRSELAARVIARYQLEDQGAGGTVKSLVVASADGALDSGIRAAGGVALANGMARTTSALGGAVAAPLTIASILVDVGKEYYDYRKKYSDRKSLGVMSTTTEQLMMQEFRLKTGEVIVSRTAAAAGAGLGAYSVASALGMWSTAGIAAGPVGIVAATSAAVVGGMLGFFAGSKAYSASTSSYFTSQRHAKEHIDRLELGARLMFDEYDPNATGEISKEDCIRIMTKLFEATGSVSESGYERTLAVIQDDSFEGPVTWSMFWMWVSTEAAQSLRKMEHEEAAKLSEPVQGETWWASYMSYFSYGKTTLEEPVRSSLELIGSASLISATMYPGVRSTLKLMGKEPLPLPDTSTVGTTKSVDDGQESAVVMKAQMEYLVNAGHLTADDAFQLRDQLESDDLDVRQSARKTINAMRDGLADVEASQGIVCEGFGFTGGDEPLLSDESEEKHASPPDKEEPRAPTKAAASSSSRPGPPGTDERLDVMCSLMSTQGLQRFLLSQNLPVASGDGQPLEHAELHCLALENSAPTPAKRS